MTLAEFFPEGDYRFRLRFERGEPAEFFAPTIAHTALVAERRRWLRQSPQAYAGLRPAGEPLLAETVALAVRWHRFAVPAALSPWEQCLALGEFWEADFLLLQREASARLRLDAGCVCFPSSWRFADKLGQPLELIHAPVPGLNSALGPAMARFISGLKPGAAALRHNWGLARSPELNHHPDRALPRLDATVRADEVWLRVEHQALVALPTSGGLLFGIRVVNHPLAEVLADAVARRRLAHALITMPEAMARYKGLESARARLLELLSG